MSDKTKEEIVENINFIVEKHIQPAVEMHGGVVKLEEFDMETGDALMLLSGACSGCASSSITLKLGVENMLKHYIPEVKSVQGVDDPNFNDPYFKKEPNPLAPTMSYEEMLDELEQVETNDKKEEND